MEAKLSKFLVVDDSMVIRKMVRSSLEKEGHEVVQAENGQEGLDIYSSGEFDLVVTDINMPIMNGFEMTEKIRSIDGQKGKVPIIVVSTEFSDETKAKGKEVGVNAWMVKPCEHEQLLELIGLLLKK